MTKELLQQALDEAKADAIYVFTYAEGISAASKDAIEYMHSWLSVYFEKQALAQQEQCGCREGECETKKDKTCRMTIEIAERDGIPEWTPAIGIECAISSLRDDAARLRDGGYTPLQIADDLDVIANDLAKCKPDAQQEQPAKTERQIRRMFCATYASDSSPYMDDGEAQDNSMFPCIDFLRDSPEQIQSKMMERAIAKHKAQQEQPVSVDAYNGAREDVAIWKKRALEAEGLNRKFIAEVNGPTYLGEPVKQEQPAQKPDLWKTQFLTDVMTAAGLLMHGRTDKKLAQRIADGSARWRTKLYASAPTQPALSDDEILNCFYASKSEGMAAYMLAVGRAIEAHCRGGATS